MPTPPPCRNWQIFFNTLRIRRSILVSTILLAGAIFAGATLPELPRGVSVLNTAGNKALRDGILGNPAVDMISLAGEWNAIQRDESSYNWDDIDSTISTVANSNKSVLLRILTMGGSATNLGNTPDWVFTDMGELPDSKTADPGVTYSWTDSGLIRCIPVFWNPVYLAKKKIFLAMAGAHLSGDTALKIVVVSYANAVTEDWNIPDDATGSPSQLQLWQNQPTDATPGAGYTTQKMIDAAIHQADATFSDGFVSATTLTSASATFTQADIGCVLAGWGYRKGTFITAWLSPTQVVLNQALFRGKGSHFKMVARKDGLIDVAMAAFPNQYISGAVSGNGPYLDANCATGEDAGTCLASTVDNLANMRYPGRYIVQRNNVTAIIPYATDPKVDTTAWVLLNEAVTAEIPTAGQALGTCYVNGTGDYRMNGGTNCDNDNPDCDPNNPPCDGICALDFDMILQKSADRIASYFANYYEVYPPDASNLKDTICNIHTLLNPTGAPCTEDNH